MSCISLVLMLDALRPQGCFDCCWCGRAGTNDNSVYVYDIESKRCVVRLSGHNDDVNAVAYLHGDTNSGNGSSGSNPHIVVSGSDDSMVRVWDLRDKSGSVRAPAGVLVGELCCGQPCPLFHMSQSSLQLLRLCLLLPV